MLKGTDQGRDAWYCILLVYDEEMIRAFKTELDADTINLESFGQILKSDFGKYPPNEFTDEI